MKSTTETDRNALKTIRDKLGYTQAQAAQRLKMSRSLWSAIENKERPLTVRLLNQIQVAFDLTDDEVNYIRTWWGDAHLSNPS